MTGDRASYDTFINRGDCFDFSLTYTGDDGPTDLTDFTAEMVVYWSYQIGKITKKQISGSVTMPGVIATPVNGTITFHMIADDTDALPTTWQAAYQIRLIDSDGCKTTVLVGNLNIFKNLFEAT